MTGDGQRAQNPDLLYVGVSNQLLKRRPAAVCTLYPVYTRKHTVVLPSRRRYEQSPSSRPASLSCIAVLYNEANVEQTYLKYTCTTCALSLLHVCFIV